MNPLLKKIKNIYSEPCVSIIMNTHRTKPENQKDVILLKNLVKEAEERLNSGYDKRLAREIIDKMNILTNSINHNFNLESLVIYINNDFADFTRLPVHVEDRVVIDNTFATRDIIRAMHQESSYYVLVLSRQNARLIEAYNKTVVHENTTNFPIANTIYATDKMKLSTAKGQDVLIEEFFNKVDKTLFETIKDHPLPILLATEARNFDYYLKIADKKNLIIGHINRNRDDEQAHQIVADAWDIVLHLTKQKNAERIKELHIAVSENKFISDYTEIWNAIQEGRGKTLFVKRGFFQPAKLTNGKVELISQIQKDDKEMIDDIIDEMIEFNLAFGGDIVFVENDELSKFNNIALATRY